MDSRARRYRMLTGVLGVAMVALTIATVAFGARTEILVQGGTRSVIYRADRGERNQITVEFLAGAYVFTDAGARIVPGSGCAGVGVPTTGPSNRVTCSGAGVVDISPTQRPRWTGENPLFDRP